ncbi:MAG: hypothetical protein ACSLE0_23740 [Chitinophagaceae bacterium]
MKKLKLVAVVIIAIFLCLPASLLQAQDPVKADAKHYKVILENNEVRVLRIKYGAGEKSVMHYHPESVAVFMTDLKGEFKLEDGSTMKSDGKAGDVVMNPAGKHLPQIGNKAIEVIQVELKSGNPPRWTTKAPEIESVKSLVKDYENGNWGAWSGHYADTAKAFHNSVEGISPAALQDGLKSSLSKLSGYRFSDKEIFYERIVDNDGDIWVYFWGTWIGKVAATNKEIIIPVHLAMKFVNNKIVREYGFYDMSKLINL